MAEIPKFLEELKAKKAANTKAQEKLTETVSDSAVMDLDDKFSWHSKVNNYVNYALGIGLFLVASLSLYGYLRLDDKISSEGQFLSQRLDSLQQFASQRLDEQSRFTTQRLDEEIRLNTQRLDEEIRLNTQRLDNISNSVAEKDIVAAPVKKQLSKKK